ncbi:hypothetical protein HYH03_006437 [Edaphochlamys debaryana]|uniref:SET domain-containing protein n=1 Tax=Edaphochlamys debaryana TaxID=47281 RepID=A0A836C1D4_9CHLO|nr:hypothetical protein HYH03_006437 [Edaphochlamys debaryana]|eukprot:KAG2495493.1 hypothetical protein HYH03_006437 [Edaphochlamys debaryana]
MWGTLEGSLAAYDATTQDLLDTLVDHGPRQAAERTPQARDDTDEKDGRTGRPHPSEQEATAPGCRADCGADANMDGPPEWAGNPSEAAAIARSLVPDAAAGDEDMSQAAQDAQRRTMHSTAEPSACTAAAAGTAGGGEAGQETSSAGGPAGSASRGQGEQHADRCATHSTAGPPAGTAGGSAAADVAPSQVPTAEPTAALGFPAAAASGAAAGVGLASRAALRPLQPLRRQAPAKPAFPLVPPLGGGTLLPPVSRGPTAPCPPTKLARRVLVPGGAAPSGVTRGAVAPAASPVPSLPSQQPGGRPREAALAAPAGVQPGPSQRPAGARAVSGDGSAAARDVVETRCPGSHAPGSGATAEDAEGHPAQERCGDARSDPVASASTARSVVQAVQHRQMVLYPTSCSWLRPLVPPHTTATLDLTLSFEGGPAWPEQAAKLTIEGREKLNGSGVLKPFWVVRDLAATLQSCSPPSWDVVGSTLELSLLSAAEGRLRGVLRPTSAAEAADTAPAAAAGAAADGPGGAGRKRRSDAGVDGRGGGGPGTAGPSAVDTPGAAGRRRSDGDAGGEPEGERGASSCASGPVVLPVENRQLKLRQRSFPWLKDFLAGRDKATLELTLCCEGAPEQQARLTVENKPRANGGGTKANQFYVVGLAAALQPLSPPGWAVQGLTLEVTVLSAAEGRLRGVLRPATASEAAGTAAVAVSGAAADGSGGAGNSNGGGEEEAGGEVVAAGGAGGGPPKRRRLAPEPAGGVEAEAGAEEMRMGPDAARIVEAKVGLNTTQPQGVLMFTDSQMATLFPDRWATREEPGRPSPVALVAELPGGGQLRLHIKLGLSGRQQWTMWFGKDALWSLGVNWGGADVPSQLRLQLRSAGPERATVTVLPQSGLGPIRALPEGYNSLKRRSRRASTAGGGGEGAGRAGGALPPRLPRCRLTRAAKLRVKQEAREVMRMGPASAVQILDLVSSSESGSDSASESEPDLDAGAGAGIDNQPCRMPPDQPDVPQELEGPPPAKRRTMPEHEGACAQQPTLRGAAPSSEGAAPEGAGWAGCRPSRPSRPAPDAAGARVSRWRPASSNHNSETSAAPGGSSQTGQPSGVGVSIAPPPAGAAPLAEPAGRKQPPSVPPVGPSAPSGSRPSSQAAPAPATAAAEEEVRRGEGAGARAGARDVAAAAVEQPAAAAAGGGGGSSRAELGPGAPAMAAGASYGLGVAGVATGGAASGRTAVRATGAATGQDAAGGAGVVEQPAALPNVPEQRRLLPASSLSAAHLQGCALSRDAVPPPALQPGELRLCGLTFHPELAPGVRSAMEAWEAGLAEQLAAEGLDGGLADADPMEMQIEVPPSPALGSSGIKTCVVALSFAKLLGLVGSPGVPACWDVPLPEHAPQLGPDSLAPRRDEGRGGAGLFAAAALRKGAVLGVMGGYVMPRAAANRFVGKGNESLSSGATAELASRAGEVNVWPAWKLLARSFKLPLRLAALINDPLREPRALVEGNDVGDDGGATAAGANCAVVPVSVRGLTLPVVVALRDIQPGEQLLRDYGPKWWRDLSASWRDAEGFGLRAEAILHPRGALEALPAGMVGV